MASNAVEFLDNLLNKVLFWHWELITKISNPALRVIVFIMTLPITVAYSLATMVKYSYAGMQI